MYNQKLSKNFILAEFITPADRFRFESLNLEAQNKIISNLKVLCERLELVRIYLNCPIHINSGWRSIEYNKFVGGARLSYHLLSKACDISFKSNKVDFNSDKLFNFLCALFGGVLHYNKSGFYHLDVRDFSIKYQVYFYENRKN